MKCIRSIEWVKQRTNEIRFVDCRFDLQSPTKGRSDYDIDHLPGAIHVDLEKDLSGHIGRTGGRHPLPPVEDFHEKIMTAGIRNDDVLVAYDSQSGAMASRFVWMMKWLGHKEVYVLDGGYHAWKDAHLPTTSSISTYPPSQYNMIPQPNMIASQEYVKAHLYKDDVVLLDSRSSDRYHGYNEPIDRKAGHIPSALNGPWLNVLNNEGKWKSPTALKDHFHQFGNPSEWIVYCGSGVTATPNVLALYEAGFTQVKLYVGSWSDWISNDDNEIVTI